MTVSTARPRCVVIGASGILAPLGRLLSRAGATTTGISRSGRAGAGSWDERVALDTSDRTAVARWLDRAGPVTVLVAYAPAVSPEVWPMLHAGSGRVVVVATTEWADPAAPAPPWWGRADVVVQLGWARDADGTRWHTPEEVSTAVAAQLRLDDDSPGQRPTVVVLGTIRPWSRRPG